MTERIITFREARNEALHQEMERDPSVIVLGEDVAGGAGGTGDPVEAAGGIFGVTHGLARKFGRDRVIDTPISESAIVGAGAGAALAGLRPVAELMFADFQSFHMHARHAAAHADRRHDSQCDEGRQGALSRRRHGWVRLQAREATDSIR